jgi:chemotaxis response regulator CheB
VQARRIAVVEDEASIAASIGARLRAEGFEVEIVGDGHAGVELCRTFRPDLVVLDPIELSADAVPALVELPLPERRWATMVLRNKLGPGDPWSSANLSRTRARRMLYESRSARKPRSRSEFETTKTLEKAIAPPAISGLRRPAAATGIAATL